MNLLDELVTGPPPEEATTAIASVPGVRLFPATVNTQSGPAAELGPESAGAVLLLQGTFAARDKFEEFWSNVATVMALLAQAPGFIRRYNFADGPHYTLIAWWRSIEDAHAFFASPGHQAAMLGTFELRWNYTHFAGLWEATSPGRRLFFCQGCDAIVPSTAAVPAPSACPACGAPLPDPCGGSRVRAASVPR